jgi:hypothetical protein
MIDLQTTIWGSLTIQYGSNLLWYPISDQAHNRFDFARYHKAIAAAVPTTYTFVPVIVSSNLSHVNANRV